MKTPITRGALAALALALTAFSAPAVLAAGGHDHHGAAPARKLAQGERWTTDAPLRESMTRMRAALETKLPAIHKGTLPPAQYKALATEVETQVASIVANCKLPPEADAALHGILGDVAQAQQAMAGGSKHEAQDGAVKLVAALSRYGREFDHPGWKPLKH